MKLGRTIRIIALVILGGFLLRIPYYFLYPTHVDDESSHAANAVVLMNGGMPYVDFADNKPPGIFYIYYAIFLLFGKYNILAARMAAFFCTLATALVLGLCAYKISGRMAALSAAVFYLTFTATLVSERAQANTEIFMALPYSLAALLLWLAVTNEKGYLYFLSGVSSGLTPLIKQVGGIEMAAVLFWLLLIPLVYGKEKWLSSLKACGAFCAGFILPGAIVGLSFYRHGVLGDAIFWCLTYPARYVRVGTVKYGFLTPFVEEFLPFFFTSIILWILCGLWIKRAVKKRVQSGTDQFSVLSSQFSIFLLLWLLSSIAAALTGSRMFSHYFIQILPPLCLIAALGAGIRFAECAGAQRKYWKAAIITLTLLPGLVFFGMDVYSRHDYTVPKFMTAAEYIRTHTSYEDRIFVWGWTPGLYAHSGRTPATRFALTMMLTGYKPGSDPDENDRSDIAWTEAPEAWPMLESDLKRNKPVLIIDTSPGNYHDFGRYPMKDYPVLNDYVAENCHLEASVADMDIYRCASAPVSSAPAAGEIIRKG